MTHDAPRRTLSFSQERLWFLDQFVRAPASNLAARVRLRGPLRQDTLDFAFAAAVALLLPLATWLAVQEQRQRNATRLARA